MGATFLGLSPDLNILSAILSVVAITCVFGGFGGAAQHLVLVLQARHPAKKAAADIVVEPVVEPETLKFFSASLPASALVGAASATGFTFFVIALFGMQEGRLDPLMALKLTSLSVIAGYAGRWLLSDMANQVSKQYVDKKMKEAEAAVGHEVRANQQEVRAAAQESARIAELQGQFRADLEAAVRLQGELAEQLRREQRINAAQKEALALSAISERLSNHDITSDPAFRDTLLRDARPFLRTGTADKLPRIWIDYARVLRAAGDFGGAIGCLKRFIQHADAGRIAKNINYVNAFYNTACYYSLWSAQFADRPEAQAELKAQATRWLKSYFALAGFTASNREGAQTDTDLDPLLDLTTMRVETAEARAARAYKKRVEFIARIGASLRGKSARQ